MRVFVTGGTGHVGSYLIPDFIAAGHEVTGLARSDKAAAALSALGARVRRGDLDDLDGIKAAAADSDGVIHLGYRDDLLPSGGMVALAVVELSIVLAFGEALCGHRQAAGRRGQYRRGPDSLGRPATEEDPALPSGRGDKGTLGSRNVVERACLPSPSRECAPRSCGSRSSCTTDRYVFLQRLIALAKEKGFAGYPGDGQNRWPAVHIRDVASLFRLALEKGPAGRSWHAVAGRGVPVPRSCRGRCQPHGSACGERSRGRPDAAGILRAVRIWSRAPSPRPAPSRADPRLATCSAQPVRRFGQRPLLPGRLTV